MDIDRLALAPIGIILATALYTIIVENIFDVVGSDLYLSNLALVTIVLLCNELS